MQDQPFDPSKRHPFRLNPIALAIAVPVLFLALLVASIAVAYRPLAARYRYSLGYRWNQKSEFDKAIVEYTEAIRLDPRYRDAYYARGFAWNMKKQLDAAIADYTEAIQLDPRYADAYYARGYARTEKHELDLAIADYNQAVQLNPRHAGTYVNRGLLWAQKKEHKNAIADFSEAIRLEPNTADMYKYRGYAWSQAGEHARALADYTEAIRLNPDDPFAHVSLAWILASCPDKQLRDAKRAVESATKACELSGWQRPDYLEMLAAACAESGDSAAAAKWRAKASTLRANAPFKARSKAQPPG